MHYAQKDNGMFILSKNDIEQIATECLREYNPSLLQSPRPLNTQDFLENHLGLVVKNKYIGDFQSGILGLTVMGDIVLIPSYDEMFRPTVFEETYGTVLISPQLLGKENRPRRRYTEMHEASHFILHKDYFNRCEQMRANTEYPCSFVVCRKVERYKEPLRTDADWLEYQADALAAALLMPYNTFITYARSVLRKNGIRRDFLAVNQFVNKSTLYSIIYDIAETFEVSYQATQIRLLHLGLIRECPNMYLLPDIR